MDRKKNVFIIAEAGVNHNGSVDLAKKMIGAAARAGADAVKFQTFIAEKLVCRNAVKAEYQKTTTDADQSQFEMLKTLELDKFAHQELLSCCRKKGIKFLSAPFDLASIDLLNTLGLDIFKIPSGEITNLPYLRKIGSLGKKIILSTGMADLQEIEATVKVLHQCGTTQDDLVVLHCNTQYPTPMDDVHLQAMQTIKRKCNVRVGYSDHTLGIEVPIAAVALGAEVIEKHFTLDQSLDGPDHSASLLPDELKAMVTAIRNIEKALGRDEKKVTESEQENRAVARKSIVAARKIRAGEVLSEENLTVKRPGTGINPMDWDRVLHQIATRDFMPDERIVLR